MDLYRYYSGAGAKLHFFLVRAVRLWKFYEAIPAIHCNLFTALKLFLSKKI